MFCNALEVANHVSQYSDFEEKGEDNSYIWQRKLSSNQHHRGIKNILVTAVRDSAIKIVEKDASLLGNVVELLENKPYFIFRRLVLYLLHEFSHLDSQLVAERLTDRTYFDQYSCQGEYDQLAQKCFKDLTEYQKMKILSWVDESLDEQSVRRNLTTRLGAEPTSEVFANYMNRRRMERIRPFYPDIPIEWKMNHLELVALLEELQSTNQEEEEEDVWVGPTSPKNQSEIGSMTVEKL